MTNDLKAFIADTRKLLITGPPKTGKTTLSLALGKDLNLFVRHGDNLTHLDWSQASNKGAEWILDPRKEIIEGCNVARALRKALPDLKDNALKVIYLASPYQELNALQRNMSQGIETIFSELQPSLTLKGIRVMRL